MVTCRGCSVHLCSVGIGRTVVIRCTAKVRASSLRWSWAVSWPPSTRAGRRPARCWCRGCRRSRSAPWRRSRPPRAARPASRSASAPPPASSGRDDAARSPARIAVTTCATCAVSRAERTLPPRARAACGPAAGRAGRRARCRPRPRPPAPRRARAAGAAARRSGSTLTSTVGAIRRSPSGAGLRVVQQLGQRRLVVGAQERLGVADPDRAERARGVVDEVGQRLRHRRPRHRRRGTRAAPPRSSRRRAPGGPTRP